LLEDLFEQLSGIVKNVNRHGKPTLFLIMTDSCLKIIQAKIKVVRRRKSVNNATISYTLKTGKRRFPEIILGERGAENLAAKGDHLVK